MLEDISVEKKMSRTVQSPKGVVEIKKNQDVTVPKAHSKTLRQREKIPVRDDQFRTPFCSTAKGKQHTKKMSTRSSHHEVGGKVAELAGLDDDFDLKRNKKQNLAHLLNIHCRPREGYSNASYQSTSRETLFPHNNSIRFLMSTHKHKYNKEQFLQANCQFVVRDDADYSIHMAEPDILVDWNLIEQIRVPSFEPGICPICLEALTAGKITRCGHIYCWPCIIHHSALTDRTWCKCPICYEAIHMKDLKSVFIVDQKCFNKGQEITFQLMKKEKGSTISVPVLEPSRISNTLLSVSEMKYTTVYSKLLTVNNENVCYLELAVLSSIPKQRPSLEQAVRWKMATLRIVVLKLIDIEEHQLLNSLKETEGTSEKCFVEFALEWLKKRKMELLARTGHDIGKTHESEELTDICGAIEIMPLPSACTKSEPCCSKSGESVKLDVDDDCLDNITCNPESDPKDLTLSVDHQIPRIRYESVSSSDELPSSITVEDLEIETPNAIPSKTYYFYQSIDGQQIYLHSLNARMLEKQYGSLEKSPHILIGNIVEIEAGSMTEELRKRLRYLDHLPITCQFQVVEIDLGEPTISFTTRRFFKDQLEKRHRLRQKKAREEQRLEKRAEMMIRKQYGCGSRSSPVRLHLDSLDHFPQCGAEEPAKLPQKNKSPRSSHSSSPASSRRSVSPVTSVMNTWTSTTNTFAQKLKSTSKNSGWQNRVRATSESDVSGNPYSGNLISDAVDAALRQARLVKEGSSGEQNVGKNKKKKRKPKTLPICSLGIISNNS